MYTANDEIFWQDCGESTHQGYITWDTKQCPDADFTKAHIKFASETANNATTLAEIGDKLGPDICGAARFGTDYEPEGSDIHATDLSVVWRLIDENKKGDCGTLSTLMKAIINLLGNNSASVKFVFSRHAAWEGLVKDTGARTNNEKRGGLAGTELGFMNMSYNYYEGCCMFQGKWWMGGLGTSQNSGYNVLMYVSSPNNSSTSKRQVWCDQTSTPVPYPSGNP